MSMTASWIDPSLVEALGWALVHFLWEGALIALALSVSLRFFQSARVRYGMACLAMLAMVAAFGVTLAVSVPEQPATAPTLGAAVTAGLGAGSGMAEPVPGILARIQSALPWVVPFWLAGALLIGLYRVGGWLSAQRLRRTGVCAAPPRWRRRLGRLARRIAVSKPVVLLESSLAEAPVVIGLLRPVILVPAGLLTGLPADQIEAILLHELAHIRRRDYLVNLMQTVVESLLFYHPAVWWVSGLIRAERENCCDDMVVATDGDAHRYAAALVALEERRPVGREPALAATGGQLVNRIRRLLNQPEEPRGAAALVLSLGLLLGVFCFLAFAQQSKPEAPTELSRPYRKWLKEDVVYIITEAERKAFERIRTDEERAQFVEQFWKRRDPRPGTPENEFKAEHYRRIAYANERFAASVPGWKTDRGRIYIVQGPPDEIEAHPGDGFERWRYRYIERFGSGVDFEFVDSQHSGDYRLRKGPTVKKPLKK